MSSVMTAAATGVFPAVDQHASDVRRMLLAALDARHAPIADDAVLAAHELFANAVLHGSQSPHDTITVTIEHSDTVVWIGIKDHSPCLPRPRFSGPQDTNGRGLCLVEALSNGWGVIPHRPGKTVWFTIHT
ncbi:ATP-binding protein [Streptomyces sp. JV176]|uniref:ATP-binding protein n=1 Tax=Streptomyces sp. JV176 TaxID=858630 RepID=UPI002E766995|nr:ATP-binding protein [Streptomyces sp. JV176]MEE1798105.1 ATP-binding protein [Streptomyces sp. JV176]